MCHDLHLFDSYEPLHDNAHYITIPYGKRVMVKYIGAIKLKDNIELKAMLYVLDFC